MADVEEIEEKPCIVQRKPFHPFLNDALDAEDIDVETTTLVSKRNALVHVPYVVPLASLVQMPSSVNHIVAIVSSLDDFYIRKLLEASGQVKLLLLIPLVS